jgi:hypothetical protein
MVLLGAAVGGMVGYAESHHASQQKAAPAPQPTVTAPAPTR